MDADKLATIRQLLDLAEHPETPPAEAENAAKRAEALIARYGVDEAMLAATGKTADEVDSRTWTIHPPYAMEKGELLMWLAQAMGAQTFYNRVRGYYGSPGEVRATVYAFQSDLARLDLLYTSLVIQAHRGLAAAEVPYLREPWEDRTPAARVAAWKRSWLQGFAMTVAARVRRAEKSAAEQAADDQAQRYATAREAAGPGVALVLADRSDQVARQFKSDHPDIKTVRRDLSGGGLSHGAEAGRRADIGTTRLGGRATTAEIKG